MRAEKEEGVLLTEKLSFDGKYLFVNANVNAKKSGLMVEVLDENNNPIPGYTKKDCIVLKNTDSTKAMITWKKKDDLSSLSEKNIRLKFYLTNGDLYPRLSPVIQGDIQKAYKSPLVK